MATAAPADAAHRPLGGLAVAAAETEARVVVARARAELVIAMVRRPRECRESKKNSRAPLLLLRLSRVAAVFWAAFGTWATKLLTCTPMLRVMTLLFLRSALTQPLSRRGHHFRARACR